MTGVWPPGHLWRATPIAEPTLRQGTPMGSGDGHLCETPCPPKRCGLPRAKGITDPWPTPSAVPPGHLWRATPIAEPTLRQGTPMGSGDRLDGNEQASDFKSFRCAQGSAAAFAPPCRRPSDHEPT